MLPMYMKRLIDGRSSLATSTMISQLSMLLFLFVLKLKMADAVFGNFLVSLGIASIVGAVASLRSEVLITQVDRCVNARTLFWPVFIAVAVVIFAWAISPLISWLFSIDIPVYTTVLAFGLSLQSICQFVLIQETQFFRLLLLRAAQAAILIATSLALLADLTFAWSIWGFAIAIIGPFAIWSVFWLASKRGLAVSNFAFEPSQLRRSAILSLTLLVNTAAVNIPIILCVATQNASYAADFGFLMKIFGAPSTLANAMFGQLFMADNIRRDISIPGEAQSVRRAMHKTSVRAIGFVSMISMGTILGVFLLVYFLPSFLTHPILASTIAIAIIAQAGFSPVSAFGDIAKLENPFLLFYLVRVIVLYGLLSTAMDIDFSVRFAAINLVVYLGFWLYADRRLGKVSNAPRH